MSVRSLTIWIVLGVAVTIVFGGAYVVAQQAARHAADHPQVEMTRDAVARLEAGASPDSVLPKSAVDLATSKDPYLIVVDQENRILTSSATLDGGPIVPPAGVFDYVRAHGEDLVTWQPAPGVRSAIVVDSFGQGFVVAGRSLADTENLESSLLNWTAAGWTATILVLGVVAAVRVRR
jgi:hypothetical protein